MNRVDYRHRIIRHGPKNPIGAHATGQEAGLDPTQLDLIEAYARRFEFTESREYEIEIDTLALPRHFATAEIITRVLGEIGFRVNGPTIEERLGAFVGEEGIVSLLPVRLAQIWGSAEQEYQTQEGVAKEDRGLLSWAEVGFDNALDGDGITLREVAYRIGDYLLEAIEGLTVFEKRRRVSISSSGFIEPFMYVMLEAMHPKGATLVDYFHQTGGALRPLQGIEIGYEGGGAFSIEIPNKPIVSEQCGSFESGCTYIADIGILQDQRAWLRDYGKAQEILLQRTSS